MSCNWNWLRHNIYRFARHLSHESCTIQKLIADTVGNVQGFHFVRVTQGNRFTTDRPGVVRKKVPSEIAYQGFGRESKIAAFAKLLLNKSESYRTAQSDSKNAFSEIRERREVLNIQIGWMKYSKIKRGLSGFINATRVSAIADTGSAQNVISAAYASDLKLPIEYTLSSFLEDCKVDR